MLDSHSASSMRHAPARKYSRGFRFAPLLALLALLSLAMSACSISPFAAPPTAQQIFDNAVHSKMKDATIAISGAVTANVSGSSTAITLSGDGQVVLKPTSASHLVFNVNVPGGVVTGAVSVDVITVGDTAYTKTQIQIPGLPDTNSNLYTRTTVPVSQSGSLIPHTATELKIMGEETIRGDKCWHLSGTSSINDQGTPVAAGTSGANTVAFEMWVRESDAYFVRIKLNTLPGFNLPLGGSSSPTGGPGATVGFVIDFSKYDQGTIITAPPADQIQS